MRIFGWAGLMMIWLALGAGPAMADGTSRQITVTGSGAVSAVPDMLRVDLSVSARARKAGDALRQMGDQVDAVVLALTEAGIAEGDLQTARLSLYPEMSNDRVGTEPPEILAFVAATNIAVISRDIGASGAILDAVVAAGVDQIRGLQFDVQDKAPLLEQARREAVADAIAKTALYADAAGVTPGAVLSIAEATFGGGPVLMEAAVARSVPIVAGTIDVTAQVTVITAIE